MASWNVVLSVAFSVDVEEQRWPVRFDRGWWRLAADVAELADDGAQAGAVARALAERGTPARKAPDKAVGGARKAAKPRKATT